MIRVSRSDKTEVDISPPALLRQAQAEPSLRERASFDFIFQYSDSIVFLHDERSYSFRNIQSFLSERGVVTNRTTLWRVYKKAKGGL